MAGDWMKIELELPDKPEVHAIASELNIDPDCVVGKLIRVWQWFDKHTVDGNAYGVTYSLPDRISGVTGFGEAMMFVGWLEQRDKYLVMPKFDRHTSASAKQRALTAKRVANKRNGNSNAVIVTKALPREEKRREDIKALVISDAADDCPYQDLIDIYHELMPNNPKCKVLNKARKSLIKSRWNESSKLDVPPFGFSNKIDGLIAWRNFFEICNQSTFLTGKSKPQQGRPAFIADIDFIFSPSAFVKTLENKYHREAA